MSITNIVRMIRRIMIFSISIEHVVKMSSMKQAKIKLPKISYFTQINYRDNAIKRVNWEKKISQKDELNESDEHSASLEVNALLPQMDWDQFLKSKVPLEDWKEIDSNGTTIHVSRTKYEMLDYLDKEMIAVKKC